MHEVELYNHDTNGDPAGSFATDAEIALAEQLRRQIEERYLAPTAPSSSLQGRSNKGQ